jgi:putative membrane protein insertion efficiency factor
MTASIQNLPRRLLIALVRAYRLLLSPWLGSACRFEPTCSAYAMQALEQHGAVAGSGLTLYRLARCQPLCRGGHDPVPERMPRWFSALLGAQASPPRHTDPGCPDPISPETSRS